ncbi:MAG TPA: O-antigen ligase family protein [bacterium]|nr:O-antigen ligase family protein [bacterium]
MDSFFSKNIFLKIFIASGFLYLFSFLSYYNVVFNQSLWLNNVFFVILSGLTLLLTIKDLRWGLLLAAFELLAASQGYLFDWKFTPSPDDFRISWRLVIFAILMLASLYHLWKERALVKERLSQKKLAMILFIANALFLVLGVYVAWRGQNAGLGGIFADLNNYLFWLYLLPLLTVVWDGTLTRVFYSGALAILSWQIILTGFFFYVFTHLWISWMIPLYKWVRDSRLGEITRVNMDTTVHRVFLQSHLYLMIAFFGALLLAYFMPEKYKFSLKKGYRAYTIFTIAAAAALLISLSRSFWVALFGVLFFVLLVLIIDKQWQWRRVGKIVGQFFLSLIMAIILIASLIWIELPFGLGSAGDLRFLSERAGSLFGSDDAAITSRWKQLPVLTQAINEKPFVGWGFAKSLTYQTDDPRLLNDFADADGNYTTDAFEWGYLDIALKIGILGVLLYSAWAIYLLIGIWPFYKSALPSQKVYYLWLLAAGIFVLFVHIFTPYLNHPLGIGVFLVILAGTWRKLA